MKKVSEEDKLKIIKEYQKGKSMAEVGKEFSISAASVLRILRNNKIEIRSKGGLYKLNEEEITNEYRKGISTSILGKKYNVTPNTIINILKRYGVQRNNLYHNLQLDNDYWKDIDRYDKAYFLGFLITDGNVIGNAVRLSISSRDVEILNVFSKKTSNENSISYTRNDATWHVKRKEWVQDLAKYGVIPNKTNFVYFPDINKDMVPHMIRGMIDGDGWISYKSHQIGFCGNEVLTKQLRDFLVETLNVYPVKILKTEAHLWQITWASKKDVKKIGEYIYQGKRDCFLKRKFLNYQRLIQVNTEVTQ